MTVSQIFQLQTASKLLGMVNSAEIDHLLRHFNLHIRGWSPLALLTIPSSFDGMSDAKWKNICIGIDNDWNKCDRNASSSDVIGNSSVDLTDSEKYYQ